MDKPGAGASYEEYYDYYSWLIKQDADKQYNQPDLDGGKTGAEVAQQIAALQAAIAAQEKIEEAQRQAAAAAQAAQVAQNNAEKALEEYQNIDDKKAKPSYNTTTRDPTLNERAGYLLNSIQEALANKAGEKYGAGVTIDTVTDDGGYVVGRPSDPKVIYYHEVPGSDEANKYLEEGRKKNLEQAAKDLQKTLDKLEEANAAVDLANQQAELAKQKADNAVKALDEILAGQTPVDENITEEVKIAAEGITKKDAEETPNFIETGSLKKETWEWGSAGQTWKIYTVTEVENWYYPEDESAYLAYIGISKISKVEV